MSIHPFMAMAAISACVCPPVAIHIAHKRAAVAHHARPRPVVHHRTPRAAAAPATRIVYVTVPCALPSAAEAAPLALAAPTLPESFARIAPEGQGTTNIPTVAQPATPIVFVPVGPPSPPIIVGPPSPPVQPKPPGAVPEPATWGMFIIGFGVIGTAMRRAKAVMA